MIKIFVKDGYVVYDGGCGPSYSIDNAVLKALYKMEMGQNKGYNNYDLVVFDTKLHTAKEAFALLGEDGVYE